MSDNQHDYVLTSEADDMLIPLSELPTILGKSPATVKRLTRGLPRTPFTHEGEKTGAGVAIRWGDLRSRLAETNPR